MNVWLAASLILAVISLYLMAIETFSVAFKLTGLANSKIRFQVASLFTGSGFTTNESELITNDERRRKIAVACMYTGHIFSVLIMGLAINVLFSIGLTINAEKKVMDPTEWYFIVFYVCVFFFLLMLLLKIPPINKNFQKFLEKIAINFSTKNRKTNIITVLDSYGKNAIVEVILNNIPSFAIDTSLFQMQLTKKYAINILSIKRGKRMVEVTKDTMFKKGDILIIYGLASDIKEAFVNSVKNSEKTIIVNNENELSLLNNYGSNALVEVDVDVVPKELDGIMFKDSHLSDRYNINIVVIKRNDEYIFADKDTIIQQNDKVTLFGPYQNIKHLFNNQEK